MAEPNQYTFTHRELAEMLVKQAGVHEGFWMLLVQFNMTAGNVGQRPNEMNPTAILTIPQIGIMRLPPGGPLGGPGIPTENNVTVDAAKVNPRGRSKRS